MSNERLPYGAVFNERLPYGGCAARATARRRVPAVAADRDAQRGERTARSTASGAGCGGAEDHLGAARSGRATLASGYDTGAIP
ncbi:hypothetical protein [Streptomyces sp. NPDC000878]